MQELVEACRLGDVATVKAYMAAGADPSVEFNKCIQVASGGGYADVVSLLLADPRVDPSNSGKQAIFGGQNLQIVGVRQVPVDPRVDPTCEDNHAIIWASAWGHFDVVKVLLADPRVDATALGNTALEMARDNEHTAIVDLLLAHTLGSLTM